MRLDFEKAVGFEFKCPECASLMQQESNEEKIAELEAEVKAIEKELK